MLLEPASMRNEVKTELAACMRLPPPDTIAAMAPCHTGQSLFDLW